MYSKEQLEDAAKCKGLCFECLNNDNFQGSTKECIKNLGQTALVYRTTLERLEGLFTNMTGYEFKEPWQYDEFRKVRKEFATLLKESEGLG